MSNQFKKVLSKAKELKKLCKEVSTAIEDLVRITEEADGLDNIIGPGLPLCDAIIKDLELFAILPKSFETFYDRTATTQQEIKAFVSNKKLVIDSKPALDKLIAIIDKTTEPEGFLLYLVDIVDKLKALSTSFEELSIAMNELLDSFATTPAPTTQWIDSSPNGRNLCGFASFVLPLNRIILSPTMLYSDTKRPPQTKRFINRYLKELDMDATHLAKISKEYPIKQVQNFCSSSLKKAFVQTILDDNSGETPFDKTIEIVMIKFMTPGLDINVEDYADLLGGFMQQNQTALNAAYQQYKAFIDAKVETEEDIIEAEFRAYLKSEIDKDGTLAEDVKAQRKAALDADETVKPRAKTAAKNNRYEDVTRFVAYLIEKHPQFISLAKQHYCQQLLRTNDIYMANDSDMIYIAGQLGLRSLTINSLNHEREVTSGTTQLNTETGRASLSVKNRTAHWQATALQVPPHSEQELRECLGSLRASKYHLKL